MKGRLSPEAETAIATFRAFKSDLLGYMKKCGSGKELIASCFESDVE
ncbi:MAG: hypothetical protein SAK29_33620 [Scytonema sp. PMC 1069.18]|nr:hypothetical protein [Scytonema sp. PMC 1069.18]MEC4885763.1 hypothetical protein [Scytonema sp. PMC 1070.18]